MLINRERQAFLEESKGLREEAEQDYREEVAEQLLSVAWFFDGLALGPAGDNPYELAMPGGYEADVPDALVETFEAILPGKCTADELQEISLLANIAVGAAMERTGKVPAEYEEAVEAAVNWMSRTHDGERG